MWGKRRGTLDPVVPFHLCLNAAIDEVARPVWQSLYLLSYFAGAQILFLSLVLCDPVMFHDSVPTPIVFIVC